MCYEFRRRKFSTSTGIRTYVLLVLPTYKLWHYPLDHGVLGKLLYLNGIIFLENNESQVRMELNIVNKINKLITLDKFLTLLSISIGGLPSAYRKILSHMASAIKICCASSVKQTISYVRRDECMQYSKLLKSEYISEWQQSSQLKKLVSSRQYSQPSILLKFPFGYKFVRYKLRDNLPSSGWLPLIWNVSYSKAYKNISILYTVYISLYYKKLFFLFVWNYIF